MPRRKKIETVNVAALTAELAKIDARRAEIVEALTAERARVAAELAAIDAVVKVKTPQSLPLPQILQPRAEDSFPNTVKLADAVSDKVMPAPAADPLEIPAYLKRGSA